jgi:two-component system sensor histidine kinase QseC
MAGMREPRAPRSLARDLLLLLVFSVALAWLVTAVISYFEARHELDELLDAHLTQTASLLLVQAADESGIVDAEHAPQLHRYGRRVAFQIWENGAILRLHSANAPDTRLSPRDEGFSDVVVDDTPWRVFSAWDPGRRYLVQVAERLEARNEIIGKVAKNMLVPLGFALPALAILIWLGIRRAMRPLRLLNHQVQTRAPDNLAPIELLRAPEEVAPLAASLNRLFARVRASIENERRFTADAAHELRTPLAALRAQAQVARGASDDAERRRALDKVIEGCDRASHLVQQLLTLARLEPEHLGVQRSACDVRAVLQRVIADLAPSALAKDIEIVLAEGPSPAVAGDGRLLEVLFRNLVDNAVRYSPPKTTVRVRVERVDESVVVTVMDEGPGVPAEERDTLGRRFHRLVESRASGSGLGLSIVKRIAQLHGGTIAFGETAAGVGLAVTTTLPAIAKIPLGEVTR